MQNPVIIKWHLRSIEILIVMAFSIENKNFNNAFSVLSLGIVVVVVAVILKLPFAPL